MTDEPQPTYPSLMGTAPKLVIQSGYEDEETHALWIHRDLVQVRKDWAVEAHVGPSKCAESFGDVASWAKYVNTYAEIGVSIQTWNAQGLRAILDYINDDGVIDRCQWTAACPFVKSPEWRAWEAFAGGQAVTQRTAVEKLEDLAEDIKTPPPADLLLILRNLRTNVSAHASTELRPDGTTSVAWSKDQSVKGQDGTIDLPSLITIAIPVLKGDPQPWEVKVRVRVSVDDQAHLTLRFSLVNAERVLEAMYAERVTEATALLGKDATILRAADAP